MPKSKRDKKISLTQTRKKGLELKQKMIDQVKTAVDSYARIFTYSVHNMRNSKFKEIRQDWIHSRFFMGKNKVTMVALGRGVEDEYKDNLHKISRQLVGQKGLLFTNKSKDEVLQWFNTFSEPDFARSGNVATQTVIIEEGPVPVFSHALEPHLRQLGLPTSLQRGVIHVLKDYKLCEKGQVLNPEQCRLLKLFGHQMAQFHFTIHSMWQNDGTFETFTDTRQDPITAPEIKLKPPKPKKRKTKKEMKAENTADFDDDDDEQIGLEDMEDESEEEEQESD